MSDLKITCNRCKMELTHHCNPDLKSAVIALYKWRPEIGFPEKLKEDNDFLPDKESKEIVDDDSIPFMCEAYLYALLGKEDGRTLAALIGNLIRETGIDPLDMKIEAYGQLGMEKKERGEREQRRKARLAARSSLPNGKE